VVATLKVSERLTVDQIKLVIWDLDDTFWSGTISEGPIRHIKRNQDIVIALAKRGIVSSICSKNDESAALAEFQKSSIADYFVLPSIDWSPKGPRIRQLIEDLDLRPTNVLFIDDLVENLDEARFVSPELNVALPEILETLLDNPSVSGKPDRALKRLKQYKVLEQKISEQSAFRRDSKNLIRQSEIKAAVLPPIENDIERLEDLIYRSNHLDSSKRRVGQSAQLLASRGEREKISSQPLRFLVVGGFNTVFNWLIFSLLVWYFGHDFYLWSLVIMYTLGSVVGFVLYRRYVFPVTGNVLKDISRYQLISFGPFVFNVFFLVTLIGWLGFDPVIGQSIFVVINALWSFLGHKYFSFRR
jgi:FkbH-like protein